MSIGIEGGKRREIRRFLLPAILFLSFPLSHFVAGGSSFEALAGEEPAGKTPPPAPHSLAEIDRDLDQMEETLSKIRSRVRRWQFEISDQEKLSASVKIFRQYNVDTGRYRLSRVRFKLDDFEIYQEIYPEGLIGDARPHAIYEGSILPGRHVLFVEMIFESKPSWFLGRQRPALKVIGKYPFEVREGEALYLNTICEEEVSAVANYQKKLKIRFVKE
ncbi:MAG: hypothetical protein D6812_07725 [Deltaproteobacteria bacterium]|nr:MAG: hypothetical protein D6812_07725 [Deltaproteobacteria bacterium]